MTLLRMVRGLPDPQLPTLRVLEVDDFALRRGHHYGTLLVDVESGRPVDVLSDRTAEPWRTGCAPIPASRSSAEPATDPATLDPADQARLDAILAISPHLTALTSHVRAFAAIMCSLRGHDLPAWLAAIDTDDTRPAGTAILRTERSSRPGRGHRRAHSALEQRSR